MRVPTIIAIDGPAASGKSTVALKLAGSLGYLYFDLGR
jgi:cytidylate kinase